MSANYNNAAWFYDSLSHLIYGKALINAQVYPLQYIPANSNILIVGGGTGRVLAEIAKIQPSGLNITYVEVAPKMIAASKKRNSGGNHVIFINEAMENASFTADFDVVITPFLFDSFTEQTLLLVFNRIHALLKPGGLWLYCDFQQTGKWWQKVFLKSMFLFFKITCDIEATRLPDIEQYFEALDYKTIASRTFFRDFIISKVYVKASRI